MMCGIVSCLFSICISFLVKCLLKSFALFSLDCFLNATALTLTEEFDFVSDCTACTPWGRKDKRAISISVQ